MNQFPPLGPQKGKFSPELRFMLASLLCVLVILGWTAYFGPKPPTNIPKTNTPGTATPTASAGAGTENQNAVTPETPATVSASTAASVSAKSDSQERTIVVENELYRVEFSNRGAVVKSWQLKKYKDDSKPQKPLDVVHAQAAQYEGGWPFSLSMNDPQLEKAANTGLYKVSSDANSLTAPADLAFTWSEGHLEITKTFHFDHSYVVNV